MNENTPAAPSLADHLSEHRSLADTSLKKYFETAVKFEASDILMRGGQKVKLRLRGVLKSLDTPPLDEVEFEKEIEASLSPAHWEQYAQQGSVDLGTDFPMPDGTSHRFRINIFRTRGRSAIAARRVSNKILNFKDLYLPPALEKVCLVHQGLVLLAGVTGSGKSTTIASMLQYINDNRACHIVTLEDPIEYLFTDSKAIVNQREIGIDVTNFALGMRAMVRENPDVILIGEMRDRETFETALQAAETGHLVFGTIHASSASQAFGRIYDLFPPEERDNIRTMLAYQMVAFVYQKLMPTISGDPQRVPAVEVLLQSAPTRKYILEGKEHDLDEVIKEHRNDGMQTFTDSLVDLVERNLVAPKVAIANSPKSEEVKMRLKGIG